MFLNQAEKSVQKICFFGAMALMVSTMLMIADISHLPANSPPRSAE
jgi:hypothetical protein